MAGAMAASWISPLKRSHWDDSPSPVGPWKALASGSLESKFFLGCGFPPPLQHSWQAPGILEPTSPCGARSLDGLGPGPGSGEHTAHHCEHYHQQCTRRTDSFSLGTESLGPGRLQLLLTPWRRQGTAGQGLLSGISNGWGGCSQSLARHCPCGQDGGSFQAQVGANTLFLSVRWHSPPKIYLQPPGCKYTHSISSTRTLDPWLTLYCNSSVVQIIFI